MTGNPAPIGVDVRGSDHYSAEELNALGLADELRDRVRREREVVRRLRAYLDRNHPGR